MAVLRTSNVPVKEPQSPGGVAVSYERVSFLTRIRRPYLTAVSVIGLLVLWELASQLGWVQSFFLPSPSTILQQGWAMIQSGELWSNLSVSLVRLGIGFTLGATVGIILGLLTGFSATLSALLEPLIAALMPIPKIAILPLLILWLGIGEAPKLVILGLATFFPVFMNTVAGVRGADEVLLKVAVSYGSGFWSLVRKVLLPSALPSIFSGLRLGSAYALLLLVAAEMIAVDRGIGFMILNAGDLLQTTKLFVGILTLSLLGILSNSLFLWLERILVPWR
jgi:NitT/TauT family transport system permease protein